MNYRTHLFSLLHKSLDVEDVLTGEVSFFSFFSDLEPSDTTRNTMTKDDSTASKHGKMYYS